MFTLMKKIYILFVLFGFYFHANAQDCTGYHQYHCVYSDYTYFYSRQSKSALFSKGQSSEMGFVAYAGEEYYINVCAHRKFGNIQFKVMMDNDDRTLIYDNASDNYSPTVVFQNEITHNMIIEVTVPDEKGNMDRRCVGVLIQFRKIDGTSSD